MKPIELLTSDDIEVKIKQVTAKGAVALLYKTARVDMAFLDETFGAENWTDDYKEIKGNLYCGIGVRESKDAPFVWKWDCGIESREDSEGNEKKGEASDAFKRAAVKWGIGRELYSAPFIFLNVETVKNDKGKYDLANSFAKFNVASIEYDKPARVIQSVVIEDDKGNVVYGKGSKRTTTPTEKPAAPEVKTITKEQIDTLLTLKADMGGLCKYFKVDRVESMTYEQAEEAIRIKRGA